MDINLDELDLKELKALRGRLERAIDGYEDRKKNNALAELEKKAQELGYSLSDLTGAKLAKPRKLPGAAPKYANPQNPAETWTGRGRKPRWVIDALGAGQSLGDFSV